MAPELGYAFTYCPSFTGIDEGGTEVIGAGAVCEEALGGRPGCCIMVMF